MRARTRTATRAGLVHWLLLTVGLAALALAPATATAQRADRLGRLLAQLRAPSKSGDQMPQLVARSFFAALMRGDVDAMRALCHTQVSFDGHWIEGDGLRPALQLLTERARLRALKLNRLVLLSPARMNEIYGPPPARLEDAVGRRDKLALARFNRHGAVAVLTKSGKHWRIKALTD